MAVISVSSYTPPPYHGHANRSPRANANATSLGMYGAQRSVFGKVQARNAVAFSKHNFAQDEAYLRRYCPTSGKVPKNILSPLIWCLYHAPVAFAICSLLISMLARVIAVSKAQSSLKGSASRVYLAKDGHIRRRWRYLPGIDNNTEAAFLSWDYFNCRNWRPK